MVTVWSGVRNAARPPIRAPQETPMVPHLLPLAQPSSPPEAVPAPGAPPWRRRLLRLRLRLWAWWVCRTDPGAHPVAELIARGQWRALDRLLADLDGRPAGGAGEGISRRRE
jgi:hypothetical protein